MVEPAKRKATYSDLEAVPSHLVAEIIFGSLVTHPRPLPRHAAAHSGLNYELSGPFQRGNRGPGGWIFLTEPELHLGEHVVVPDIAGWRRVRLNIDPDRVAITIAPDWLCEILSPSTELYDRNEKRRIYAQSGVSYYWILDPRVAQLECFQLVAGNWLLTNTFTIDEVVKAPPFVEHSFPLRNLFPFDEAGKSSE